MSNKKPLLIQSDFDNTITIGNVSEQIHDEFGPSDWDSIYKNYRLGKISVEESNIYSFRYLNYSETVNLYVPVLKIFGIALKLNVHRLSVLFGIEYPCPR